MSHQQGRRNPHPLKRIARVLVPWAALAAVVFGIGSAVMEYRAASSPAEATATVEAGGETDTPVVRVLSDGLNLRLEPSTTAQVVKSLNADQRLELIEEGTGWYHVRDADGSEGWVAAGGHYTELVAP
ncbi:MAG: SH3 domain-containing protein [Coriobacteriia bacterium]|nr:SH3 domain-containing protein [Coriobacteriia bacterium]